MYDPIFFSAYKSNGTNDFYAGMTITDFTGFATNVGNASNFILSSGIFLAPRNGIYEFSASLSFDHTDGYSNDLAVMKNQEQFLQINLWTSWASNNGFNWIMELQKGDQLQLQVISGHFRCDTFVNCVFSGKIIEPFI